MSASLLLVVLGLCVCSQASSDLSLGTPRLFGPSEGLVKQVLTLHCELQTFPEGELILLELIKKDVNKSLGMYTLSNTTVASFPLVIRTSYDGELVCVAKAQNNTDIQPTFSSGYYLKVIEPLKRAKIDVRSSHLEFFEGLLLEMICNTTAGTHVSYTWQRNGRNITRPLHHNRFIISSPTSKDSGSYVCLATNYFNNTMASNATSAEVVITVKDLVSIPDISYAVLKDESHNYSASVTCESVKGTPPITFSLYKNKTEMVDTATVEERKITFKIPLHLPTFESLHCEAKNGNLTVQSERLPLEVVLVGGPVTIDYDVDIGETYAVVGVRFYCRVAKGSHPHYQWFLNNTLLKDTGSFYYVHHRAPVESTLLLAVGWSSTGTYHCSVSDSFDNSTVIRSKRLYLERDGVNRLDIWVVALVFGSFTLVVLLVSICCCVGILFRQNEEKSLSDLEMKNMVAMFDDKMDESGYSEDTDVVQAARAASEPDQASEGSVDEWPQIEEEKKTLEDEPVEEP